MGILLVIFAHLYTSEGTDNTNVVRTYIYGFHMPFFFIISGFLYKTRDAGLKQAITLNFKRLLIPYLCLNVFFAIVNCLKFGDLVPCMKKLFGFIFGGGTPCGASWFIITLFFIKCIYDILCYNKIEKLTIPIIFLSTLIINHVGHNFFYIKSVLIGICFFHLGKICFKFINNNDFKLRTFEKLIISFSLLIVSYYITLSNGKVSLYGGAMGNSPLMFYTNAIIGSLGIIFLSLCFEKIQSKTICEMSKASIAVVLLHMTFVVEARNGMKHFNISGMYLFITYAVLSIVIYYLCIIIFKITNKKIPFIWGK